MQATRPSFKPILIVRGHDPHMLQQMRGYFSSRKNCIYLPLGVTCSWADLFEEILMFLTKKELGSRRKNIDQMVRCINELVRSSGEKYLFVIDNCHLIKPFQIFSILGLAIELEGLVQLIFIFPEELLTNWVRKKNAAIDPRIKYFIKSMQGKYAIAQ